MAAVLFDLDGTLVDSVYQHVAAFHVALRTCGIDLPLWIIHRKIGMSDGLAVQAIARESSATLSEGELGRLREVHGREYEARLDLVEPLPGAIDLLDRLTRSGTPWIIATSSHESTALRTVQKLGLSGQDRLVTRDDVARGKPYPDLFAEAARRLTASPNDAIVVGDSIWDHLAAKRLGSLSVGVLTGGYARSELHAAGAVLVYQDAAELTTHLEDLALGASRPDALGGLTPAE